MDGTNYAYVDGAVLSRAGFNRKAAYATGAMAIAAELPDIDIVWSVLGPLTGFEHHRGITHTFVGVPIEAALVALGLSRVLSLASWEQGWRTPVVVAVQRVSAGVAEPSAAGLDE